MKNNLNQRALFIRVCVILLGVSLLVTTIQLLGFLLKILIRIVGEYCTSVRGDLLQVGRSLPVCLLLV